MSNSPDMRANVVSLVSELKKIDNEIEMLKEQRKELIEDYKSRLDIKTLKQAMQLLKLENTVVHKNEFDEMVDILKKEFAVI